MKSHKRCFRNVQSKFHQITYRIYTIQCIDCDESQIKPFYKELEKLIERVNRLRQRHAKRRK